MITFHISSNTVKPSPRFLISKRSFSSQFNYLYNKAYATNLVSLRTGEIVLEASKSNFSTYLRYSAIKSKRIFTFLICSSLLLGCLTETKDYSSGLNIAVGREGLILTSPDAIVWKAQSSGTTLELSAVAYSGSTYVIVGEKGTVLTSQDASIWTARTSGVTGSLDGIVYAKNKFVVVGSGGKILTSSDGISWSTRSSGTTNDLTRVIYGGNKFVAVGSYGAIVTSVDGINWTLQAGVTESLGGVVWDGSKFIATTYCFRIYASNTGTQWNMIYGNSSCRDKPLWIIATSGSKYFAIGRDWLESANGNDWQVTTMDDSLYHAAMVWRNGIFIREDNDEYVSTIRTSPDGISWSNRYSGGRINGFLN